jgi:adenylate cyclase
MRSLHDIEGCFQGVIPAYMATCSATNEPNLVAVSIVHLLGPNRVGVSCQFLNKTLSNLRENARAQLSVLDPASLAEYWLDLRFDRLIEQGPVFDKMSAQLDAIASHSGMTGTFALAGVAEFEVCEWRASAGAPKDASAKPNTVDPVHQLERISAAMEEATDLDALLERTFEVLARELGLEHGFLLLADGAGEQLYNIASHGFDQAHFGAEIALGEGLYGTAAARRTVVRTGSMRRERMMWQAVARESAQKDPTYLPLPGLPDVESSLAVPLVRGERCIGVLCFQSAEAGAFTGACEQLLTIVARHLAAMMVVLGAGKEDVQLSAKRGPVGGRALVTRVKFFESDGSVFVDDQYLIKGVAGRVLWHVLNNYKSEHRDEFSSKEIRLDPDVGLPALKDNLEARLIALRMRLNERTTALRIEKTGRGRFRLEVARELSLERLP